MKLKSIGKVLGIATIAFVIAGCGGGSTGGSGSDGAPPQSSTEPPITEQPSSTPFQEIQNVNDGDLLSVGTYFGYATNYYDFHMPKKGNLVIRTNSGAYLYDENLNEIETPYEARTIQLEAGDYIIKTDHGTTGYTYTLTLNSNVLYNQYDLPLISNGTQSDKNVQYYRINMPKKGNLLIDSNSALYMYDMDLNFLGRYSHKTIELESGDYVIGFDHEGPPVHTYTFSLQSNVW